jgi:hypothetical protein
VFLKSFNVATDARVPFDGAAQVFLQPYAFVALRLEKRLRTPQL